MYLLDTNVVSELQKMKPHGAVASWFGSIPQDQLFLSAIVLAEIQSGIELVQGHNAARAALLTRWLDQLPASYQVLPLDGAVCREWARLMHGRQPEMSGDAFVAATARVHGMVVVTRNLRDFRDFGVELFDPFVDRR